MNRSIKNFESWIDDRHLLNKGKSYWESHSVQNLQQDEDDWEADVHGTDDYLTSCIINNGQVADWYCDCPYDHGPICKHVVAVLFAVRAKLLSTTSSNKTTKEETNPSDPIAKIIEKLEESELRKLITYLAGRQEKVRSHLLSKYTHLLEIVSKSQYEQLVRSYIEAHSGERGGYVDYHDADHLGDKLLALIEDTDSSTPMATVYLCETIIHQLAFVYQYADDSSGSIGGAIGTAIFTLSILLEEDEESPMEVIDYIFNYTIKECNKKIFQNWGDDLRDLACNAVRNKAQAAQAMEVLNEFIEANQQKEHRAYYIEAAERLKLELLGMYHAPEAAEKHLNNNLQYTSFREMALEKAMKKKNYELVRQLAEAGIVQDKENAPGRVKDWKKWLIQLSKETGDTTSFIKINEELFLNRGDMDYYRKLKEIIPKKEFKVKIESYIQYFRKKEDTRRTPIFNSYVALILKEENRLEDLMAEVKKSPSLHLLDQYFNLLGKPFKEDFLLLYGQLIRSYMDMHTGRGKYQDCCRYIDKIINLGGLQTAKIIVANWRKQYPRRRAMMEELGRYKW